MAKTFTRIGKDIVIAVKAGGPDPDNNSKLRMIIQNAKSENMPKDRVEAAIKRASSKDESNYEEIVYEGYGPYGVAILAECATDNPTRTVANVRMYFTRAEGTLGKTGSLDFIFTRKGIFKISAAGVNKEDLELDLIDHGLEEIKEEDGSLLLFTSFTDFGAMQKVLESKGIEVISAELKRIPNNTIALNEEQQEEIYTLIEKFEEDDDVQAVYHNMKEEE